VKRLAFGKLAALALATFVAGSAVVSCSTQKGNSEQENVGDIGLNLDVGAGVDVDLVNYTITGNGITPITGTIDVSDPGSTVSAIIFGIPAGSGYTINMTATSSDGAVSCAGSNTFSVTAGQQTLVGVDLQCTTGDNNGGINVDGTFNQCPVIARYTVAPAVASVPSGRIFLTAGATDTDDTTLTYNWTATAGTIAAANAANTFLTCTTAGNPVTLTLTVTDGTCTDTASVNVRCRALACGNGQTDPGETCDDGNTSNGDACPADCTLPICGDGILEGVTGGVTETCDPPGANCPADCTLPVCGDNTVEAPETCDPPGVGNCSANCRLPICGNGVVEAGEQCEPPNTATCSATCQNQVAAPVCGNNIVQPPETCDPPFSANECGGNCGAITSPACLTCGAAGSCGELQDCGLGGTPEYRTACLQVLDCVRDSGCGSGLAFNCYCGTASSSDCSNGLGNGACRAALETGLQTTNPNLIADRFTDPTFGGGLAMLRVGCEQSECFTQCFGP